MTILFQVNLFCVFHPKLSINKKIKLGISESDTIPLNQYENQPDYPNKCNECSRCSKNYLMFHFFILILIIIEHLPNLDSLSTPL